MKSGFLLLFVACLLAACGSVSPPAPTLVASAVPATAVARFPSTLTSTPTPIVSTEAALPPTATLAATATKIPPSVTPLPACVKLIYEEYAQVELIGPDGLRVLVDVLDPAQLTVPATNADILLTTHTHWDHVNTDFQTAFPGAQLMASEGNLDLAGAKIRGIASAHNDGDAFRPEGGTNYIYLIEMAGLRIAHFGDIGQNVLTETQLEALIPLDVAIIQLANSYSDMDAENQKALKLIEQVAPRLIIPTHVNLDTAALAVERWPGWYREDSSVMLCLPGLPEQTQILFMGQSANTFLKYLDLRLADW